jgi:hypothetical protein
MLNVRVFGIGLSKTGTTSLTRALEILGYRTNHFPYSALRYHSGQLSLDLDRLCKWDACTDSPIALFHQLLEQKFPEGKFILTKRDINSWLDSCQYNHVWPGNYVRNKAIRLLPHVRKILCLHRKTFGAEIFHRDIFREAYEAHEETVIDYFAQKKKELLIIDICGGDSWAPLCDFLNHPVPEVPFPRENVGKFKRLKRGSRHTLWKGLSVLPTPTLSEQQVQQIVTSSAAS